MNELPKKKVIPFASLSFVFGCIGALSVYFYNKLPLFGLFCVFMAIILGVSALLIINKNKALVRGRVLAISGILLGAIGLVPSVTVTSSVKTAQERDTKDRSWQESFTQGVHVVFKLATPEDVRNVKEVLKIINTRLDLYGVMGEKTLIKMIDNDKVLIQLPQVKYDSELAKKLLERGLVEFKSVEDRAATMQLAIAGNVPSGYEIKEYRGERLLLYEVPVLVNFDIGESVVQFDPYGAPAIRMKFTTEGAKKLAHYTQERVGKRVAIIFDGKVVNTPVIRAPILSGEASVEGDFSLDESRALAAMLSSGVLPTLEVLECKPLTRELWQKYREN